MDAAARANRKRIRRLIHDLASRDPIACAHAERQLLDLEEGDTNTLVILLERELRNLRRFPFLILTTFCGQAIAIGAVDFLSHDSISLGGIIGGTTGASISMLFALLRSRKASARTLSRLTSNKAIGALAYAHSRMRDPDLASSVMSALERLSPTVGPEDASALSAAHRTALHECLLQCQPPLAEMLLDMFVRIRDTDAIPAAVKMAGGESACAWNLELRAKAQDTFEQLHRIWTADQQRATLLRPAESSAEAGDMLLRAAANHPDDSAVLLRAGEAEN